MMETALPSPLTKPLYLPNPPIRWGKPAITTETDLLGRVDTNGADLAEAGVFNLLRHFKMLSGEPQRVEHPIWIDRSEVLRSPVTGIFHERVQTDQAVAKGSLLGVLTDFFGNAVHVDSVTFTG